jgi:hypothetical protein
LEWSGEKALAHFSGVYGDRHYRAFHAHRCSILMSPSFGRHLFVSLCSSELQWMTDTQLVSVALLSVRLSRQLSKPISGKCGAVMRLSPP